MATTEQDARLARIAKAWPEIVGADVARAAQPVAIEHDTLVVSTSSSAWSHQLAFLEPEIMRGVQAVPDAGVLTQLRFRVRSLTLDSAVAQPTPRLELLPGGLDIRM